MRLYKIPVIIAIGIVAWPVIMYAYYGYWSWESVVSIVLFTLLLVPALLHKCDSSMKIKFRKKPKPKQVMEESEEEPESEGLFTVLEDDDDSNYMR